MELCGSQSIVRSANWRAARLTGSKSAVFSALANEHLSTVCGVHACGVHVCVSV